MNIPKVCVSVAVRSRGCEMNGARGTKAQGQDHMAKLVIHRHGAGGGRGRRRRKSAARAEKAAETKVRHAGRKVCADY